MKATIASTDHAAYAPELHDVPIEMYEMSTDGGGRQWCVDLAGQQIAFTEQHGGRDMALGVYYFLKNCPPTVIDGLITFVTFTGHRAIEF